jgi:hypothetical protein
VSPCYVCNFEAWNVGHDTGAYLSDILLQVGPGLVSVSVENVPSKICTMAMLSSFNLKIFLMKCVT